MKGIKLGVWVDAALFKENPKFYNDMFSLGVDFIVTDFPLKVKEVLNEWYLKEEYLSQIADSQLLNKSLNETI